MNDKSQRLHMLKNSLKNYECWIQNKLHIRFVLWIKLNIEEEHNCVWGAKNNEKYHIPYLVYI
jgi:hypothetical protein